MKAINNHSIRIGCTILYIALSNTAFGSLIAHYTFDENGGFTYSPDVTASNMAASEIRSQKSTIQTTSEPPDYAVLVYDFTSGSNGFAFDISIDSGYQLALSGYSLEIAGNPGPVGGPDKWHLSYADSISEILLSEGSITQFKTTNSGSLTPRILAGQSTFLISGTGGIDAGLGAMVLWELSLEGDIAVIPEPTVSALFCIGALFHIGKKHNNDNRSRIIV